MSSSDRRLDVLKRVSLSGQAIDAIRKGIANGVWRELLPGERRLCDQFQVSRPTISTALHRLAKEGLIEIRRGRPNRILSRGQGVRAVEKRLIAIVHIGRMAQNSIDIYHGISEMRAHLADRGLITTILNCPAGSFRAQRRKIEAFLKQNPACCCILWSVNQELQQWFAAKAIPTLLLGSCYPSVRLPSIDVDNRAVCRHACGVLLGKGHRRIALIVPDSIGLAGAGTLASEEGFAEALGKRDGGRAHIVRHNGTAADLSAKLDCLFDSPRAPTALLVARASDVVFVLIYLFKRNLSVPNSVSLIARDHDSLFSGFSPPIAHYFFDGEMFSRRLTRLVSQLVDRRYLPPKAHLIFPRYFAGRTVKSLG